MHLYAHIAHAGIVACALCIVIGCDRDLDAEAESRPAEVVDDEDGDVRQEIAAVVNDREITHDQVDRHLDRLGELYRHSDRTFDETVRDKKRRQVVHRLVNRELLHEHAAQRNVDIDTDVVDRHLRRHIETKFGSHDAFRRYLDAEDLTIGDVRRRIHREVAIDTLLSERVDDADIDEQRLRNHYEEIAKKRPADDRIEATRLTLELHGLEDDETHRIIRRALDQALDDIAAAEHLDGVADELRRHVDKRDLEIEARLDESRWFERRHVGSRTAQTLFDDAADDEGQARSVTTTTGFEIYWIHEFRDAGIRGFDEVEDLLRDRARRSELEEHRRHLVEELREDADIHFDFDEPKRATDSD